MGQSEKIVAHSAPLFGEEETGRVLEGLSKTWKGNSRTKDDWYYRVVKRPESHGETYWSIRQVRYEGGVVVEVEDEPSHVSHYRQTLPTDEVDIDELRYTLTQMLIALEEPVLIER